MNQVLDVISHPVANDLTTSIARELLEPTFVDAPSRTFFKQFEIDGEIIRATYDRDPKTKHFKASNFDVDTPTGTIRCGSSARMAAGIVVALNSKKGSYRL